MAGFFLKLGGNRFYQKLMKEPLTYVTGAVLLGVFQIAHFSLLAKGWGVTSTLAEWGAMVYGMLGGDVGSWSYFAAGTGARRAVESGFMQDGGSIRNLGIICGALAATLYASQFKVKKIKSGRQVLGAVLGGLLMGYGARLAGGCNIGALFTGIASFSLSGWVFGIFLVVGAFIGARLLTRYFI